MEIVAYETKHLKEILAYQQDLYGLNFKDFVVDSMYLLTVGSLYEDDESLAFVLMDDDKIVGFYLYSSVDEDTVSLSQIYVATEYRSLGFGKQLMMHFEDQIKNSKNVNIELDVSLMNLKSVLFYKKNGYEMQYEYFAKGEYRQCLAKVLNKQFTNV